MTDRPSNDDPRPDSHAPRAHPFRQTDAWPPVAPADVRPGEHDSDRTIRSGSLPSRGETGRFRIQPNPEQSSLPSEPQSAAKSGSRIASSPPGVSSLATSVSPTVGSPPGDVLGQAANTPAARRRPARVFAPPPLARDVERLGWAPPPPEPRRERRLPSRLSRFVRLLFIVAILATTAFAAGNQELVETLSDTPQWQTVEQSSRHAVHAIVSVVAEEPSFASAPALASYPICAGTGQGDEDDLESGMNLMRATAEGERLFDQLVDEDICVRVEDIGYNSGYAYGRQSPVDGGWSDSYIAVASDLLHSGESDVVAALLIHEATHIDRYVNGLACNYSDTCTTLPNGVDLEEEIAAHGAEAQWWIAAYGSDGKRFATGYDYGLNRLARAYGEGASVFDAYVHNARSDSREGDSLAR